MKLALALSTVCFMVLSCHCTQWRDVKSIRDSPRYQELISRFYPETNSQAPTLTGRITNGTPAKLKEFPYQVYMYMFEPVGVAYLCGGSLIHKKWILTAAHCVDTSVKVEVFLGAIHRFADGTQGSFIKAIVVTNKRSIKVHEDYNFFTVRNDIALLELPEDAPIDNSFIGIISLPKGVDETKNWRGVEATVAGYGKTSDEVAETAARLSFINAPIMSNLICSASFSNIFDSNICLESKNGKSACSGDSGGPLTVVGQNGIKIQVGIVSFGAEECEQGYPQVFTRVTSFIPWIAKMTELSFAADGFLI